MQKVQGKKIKPQRQSRMETFSQIYDITLQQQQEQQNLFSLFFSREEEIEAMRHVDVKSYRCKTIRAGDFVECEIYPVWNTYSDRRKAREIKSSLAQRAQNNKNAAKRIERLAHANFTEKDIALHPTYAYAPSYEQACRDCRNYLRRLKTSCTRHGFEPLKYIYVVEGDGEGGDGVPRAHIHIITNFPDRALAEKIWGKGTCNSKSLQPDEYGLVALTRYMIKSRSVKGENKRCWSGSRNLKEPQVTVSETRIRKKHVEAMVREIEKAGTVIEKAYDGCKLVDMPEIKRSSYVSGAYIYARMRREGAEDYGKHKGTKDKGVPCRADNGQPLLQTGIRRGRKGT